MPAGSTKPVVPISAMFMKSEDDHRALADGRLPVYAFTARRGEQPAKVRHALDLLALYFGHAGAADSARTAREA